MKIVVSILCCLLLASVGVAQENRTCVLNVKAIMEDIANKDKFDRLENYTIYACDTLSNDTLVQNTDSTGIAKFNVAENRCYHIFTKGIKIDASTSHLKTSSHISTYNWQPPFEQNILITINKVKIVTESYPTTFYFKKNSIEFIAYDGITKYLSSLLEKYAEAELELHSYASCDERNPINLADKRCLAIFNHMVELGYKPENITCKAHGDTRSTNNCDCKDLSCEEKEHAVNRRLDFKVLRFKF